MNEPGFPEGLLWQKGVSFLQGRVQSPATQERRLRAGPMLRFAANAIRGTCSLGKSALCLTAAQKILLKSRANLPKL